MHARFMWFYNCLIRDVTLTSVKKEKRNMKRTKKSKILLDHDENINLFPVQYNFI